MTGQKPPKSILGDLEEGDRVRFRFKRDPGIEAFSDATFKTTVDRISPDINDDDASIVHTIHFKPPDTHSGTYEYYMTYTMPATQEPFASALIQRELHGDHVTTDPIRVESIERL